MGALPWLRFLRRRPECDCIILVDKGELPHACAAFVFFGVVGAPGRATLGGPVKSDSVEAIRSWIHERLCGRRSLLALMRIIV